VHIDASVAPEVVRAQVLAALEARGPW
jgi:hypothetical protein